MREKNIAEYLLPFRNNHAIKKASGPSCFFGSIPEPETAITVPSLDKELEAAQKAWEAEHARSDA